MWKKIKYLNDNFIFIVYLSDSALYKIYHYKFIVIFITLHFKYNILLQLILSFLSSLMYRLENLKITYYIYM